MKKLNIYSKGYVIKGDKYEIESEISNIIVKALFL